LSTLLLDTFSRYSVGTSFPGQVATTGGTWTLSANNTCIFGEIPVITPAGRLRNPTTLLNSTRSYDLLNSASPTLNDLRFKFSLFLRYPLCPELMLHRLGAASSNLQALRYAMSAASISLVMSVRRKAGPRFSQSTNSFEPLIDTKGPPERGVSSAAFIAVPSSARSTWPRGEGNGRGLENLTESARPAYITLDRIEIGEMTRGSACLGCIASDGVVPHHPRGTLADVLSPPMGTARRNDAAIFDDGIGDAWIGLKPG
jgi:hypothetical protein